MKRLKTEFCNQRNRAKHKPKAHALACAKLLLEQAETLLIVTHDAHLQGKIDQVITLPEPDHIGTEESAQ
ncbi:hypothetical protein ACJJIF_00605 (plasmid) [Microbulbifer sp. SSSA002]|uniref:hypothetical protein n=1 Tax=Microbulbifer sp. SSSA002 TaxID=3243376 RepID=UPI004039551C